MFAIKATAFPSFLYILFIHTEGEHNSRTDMRKHSCARCFFAFCFSLHNSLNAFRTFQISDDAESDTYKQIYESDMCNKYNSACF